MQISMLESKARQPGIKGHELQPIGTEIYDKLDHYFITFCNHKFKSNELIVNPETTHLNISQSKKVNKSKQRSLIS